MWGEGWKPDRAVVISGVGGSCFCIHSFLLACSDVKLPSSTVTVVGTFVDAIVAGASLFLIVWALWDLAEWVRGCVLGAADVIGWVDIARAVRRYCVGESGRSEWLSVDVGVSTHCAGFGARTSNVEATGEERLFLVVGNGESSCMDVFLNGPFLGGSGGGGGGSSTTCSLSASPF